MRFICNFSFFDEMEIQASNPEEARYMYIQELQNMLDYDCLDNNIEIEYAEQVYM